jgi:hypothetical protein
MRGFNEIIETVLFEQAPQYVANFVGDQRIRELFDAYKQTYSGTNIAADPNLENQLILITGGKRINARDIQVPFLPILDAFGVIYNALSDADFPGGSKNKATLQQVIDVILSGKPDNLVQIIKDRADKIREMQKTSNDPLDYEPIDPRIGPARRTILSETDKASQIAIESLSNETIHGAVTKIVAKRVAVVDRLMSVKGIKKPFQTSLLRPLFSEYKKYTTGGGIFYNKIPGDFSKVVDQLSITKLINVAILAGDYYLALLQQHVTAPSTDREEALKAGFKPETVAAVLGPQQGTPPSSAPTPPTVQGDSIQTFNQLIDDLLCEMPLQTAADLAMQNTSSATQQPNNQQTQAPQNQAPQNQNQNQDQKQTTLTKQEYDQIASKIGNTQMPDYVQFLEKGISQYLPDNTYTLETVSKDPLKQAQDLYEALRGIAFYTREGVGVQYRTQQAGSALKSLAAFGGQGLYGGPS